MAREKPGSATVGGFTLIEVLVVLAILAALAAMLMPAVGNARRRGIEARSLANLREVGAIISAFAAAHDDNVAPVIRHRDHFWPNSSAVGWDIDVGRWAGAAGGNGTAWQCAQQRYPFVGNARALGLDNRRTITGGLLHLAGPRVWYEPSRLVICYDAPRDQPVYPYGPSSRAELSSIDVQLLGDVSDEQSVDWPRRSSRATIPFEPGANGPHLANSWGALFADGHSMISAFDRSNNLAYLWNDPRWWSATATERPYIE